MLEGSNKVSLEPPFLQAEQPQLSQAVLKGEVLPRLFLIPDLFLVSLPQVYVFLCKINSAFTHGF